MTITGAQLWASAPLAKDHFPIHLWDQITAHVRDALDNYPPEERAEFVATLATGYALIWTHMHAGSQAFTLMLLAAFREELEKTGIT